MGVKHVKRSRKAWRCGRCGAKIEIGDAYRWYKINFGVKQTRCMGDDCYFRSSEMTSSDKLSQLYGAQESAQENISDWDSEELEDLKSILEEAASEIRQVGEEYQASADAIHENFSESATADECEEKAQECDGWADEIESVDFEDFEFDKEQADKDLDKRINGNERKIVLAKMEEEARIEWADEQRSLADDAVSNCPL
jgi:hypothetical protein